MRYSKNWLNNGEPKWVRNDDDDVISIYLENIEDHGGMDSLSENGKGLLESALTRPKNLYHYSEPKPSLAKFAIAYAYGIIHNHPFIDKNKRTALIIFCLFLAINGVKLKANDDEKYLIFMRFMSGKITEKELANFMATHSVSE